MTRVTIRPGEWGEAAAQMLSRAETPAGLVSLRRQVEDGAASLFFVEDEGGDLLAAYVLRVDDGALGPEGVIVSAAGRARFDLVGLILPHIETQFSGVVAYRMHVKRAGMLRKLARQGWAPEEFVMKKGSADGRE